MCERHVCSQKDRSRLRGRAPPARLQTACQLRGGGASAASGGSPRAALQASCPDMSEELPCPERHGNPLSEDDHGPRHALPVLQVRQENPSGSGPGRPPRACRSSLHKHGSLQPPQPMFRSSGPPLTPSSLPASVRGVPSLDIARAEAPGRTVSGGSRWQGSRGGWGVGGGN